MTTIGNLVTENMLPLVGTVETFDVDIGYWGTHDLSFIPPHLLKRIDELGKCRVINPCLSEMYEICNEFHEATKMSESVFTATTSFYPNFSELSADLIANKVETHIIISEDLYEKLRIHKDINDLKVMNIDLFHFYVYPKRMDFVAFVHNDYYVLLSPMTNNGELDIKYVLCSGPSAISWAKELFNHYLKDSTPITEL